MKTLQSTAAVLAILVSASLADGQGENEKNVQHEQLKVLQPLVGDWLASGTNEAGGYQWNYRITVEWSPLKKMIVAKAEGRQAATVDELAEQPWELLSDRYLIWNHQSQAIQETIILHRSGRVDVQSLTPNSKGTFLVSRISSTQATPSKNRERIQSITITDQHLSVRKTDRTDDVGKSLPDDTFTMTRI